MKYVFEVVIRHKKSDSYGIIILSDGEVRRYSLEKSKTNTYCNVANSTFLFSLNDEDMVLLNKLATQSGNMPLKLFETNHSDQLVKYYLRKEMSDSVSSSTLIGSIGSTIEFNPSSISLILRLTQILNLTTTNGYELLKTMEGTYLNYYSPRPSGELRDSFESNKSNILTIGCKTESYCQIF